LTLDLRTTIDEYDLETVDEPQRQDVTLERFITDGDRTVEVDETYVGGQWKNKQKSIRDYGTKRGRGTKKQPVFGILCRSGQVRAGVVDDFEDGTLQPSISRKVSSGSTVFSDTWKGYTGIAAGGNVHRLVNHGEKSTVTEKEIISMVWRGSGNSLNENSRQKVE
jgi:transposase-like protein